MENLCIASTNEGKIRELKFILGNIFKLYSLGDFGVLPEAEEPFESFLENARAKAIHYAKLTQMLTLSDDAGLCIHSLKNFPGVHTKRFIMDSGGLPNAFDRLEKMLFRKEDRRAEFICASVIYDPESGESFVGEGVMSGEIRFPAKGVNGFGLGPVFVPEGCDQTVAELEESVKATISHRGKSIGALLENYRLKSSP